MKRSSPFYIMPVIIIGLMCTGGMNSLAAATASQQLLTSAMSGTNHGLNASVVLSKDQQSAKNFIEKLGKESISFLSNNNLSVIQKQKEFSRIMNSNFDMRTIGRFALGKNWRLATAAQQKEYQKLFNDMVVEVYSSRLSEYQGQQFEVKSVRDIGKKDLLVSSHIIPENGSKIKVDWRVRNKNGRNRIIDVLIEGVSMSLTQRSDFSSVIQRGGGKVEVLLEHLRN